MTTKNPGQKTALNGVYKIGPNRYRVRAKYTDPDTGRTREIDRQVTAKNSRKAGQKRERLLERELTRAARPNERQRLGDFATNWLDAKRPEIEISTAERYLESLDLHILPHLGDVYLDRLTIARVKQWRNDLTTRGHHRADRGLAPTTINGHLRVLRTVLADALREGRIRRNVASDVRPLPEPRRTEETSNRLTAPELTAVLAYLQESEPRWYAFFLTAGLTGARFGEVSALRWEDIDHEAGTIHIRRAVKRGRDPKTRKWVREIGSTKTGDEREVAMPRELSLILREHRQGLVKSQAPGLPAGWCFPSPRAGKLLYSSSLRKPLLRALAAVGIERPVSVHGLRRTFTNLVSQIPTVRPEVVRSLTGHRQEEMRQHYTFAERDEKQAAVGGLAALVLTGGGGGGGDGSDGTKTTD